jgi:hypothetical protein
VESQEKTRRKRARDYFNENKDKLNRRRAVRWKEDDERRERVSQERKEKRALERAKRHGEQLQAQRESSNKYWKGRRVLTPRLVRIDGAPVKVYSTGVLGRMAARTMPTIRRWISNRVIPGCSWKDDYGRYWFSLDFCKAVKAAVERIYLIDGRCTGSTLRTLIVEELAHREVSWRSFDEKRNTKNKARKEKGGKEKGRKKKSR